MVQANRITGSRCARAGIGALLTGGIIVAGLELLWNLPLSRLPVYWLPTYSPLPAILLNFFLHILLTVLPFTILGSMLLLVQRRRVTALFLLVAGGGYVFYMSCTVLLRFLNLKHELHLGWRILLEICLFVFVVLGSFCWWRGMRRRRLSNRIAAWPATIVMSASIAVISVFLRWPLASIRFILIALGIIIAVHLLLWVWTRRWSPSSAPLALVIFTLALLWAVGRGLWAERGESPLRPHIAVLVWDAARADRMSLYGYEQSTTPFAASRAEHGLLFTRAHSTSNYTFPSHVTMFTGLYNREHGLWQGVKPELERYFQLETVAGALRRQGYRTVLITENPWIAHLTKGFQFYYWMDTRGVGVSDCRGPVAHLRATPGILPPFMGNCPSPFLARQLIDHIRSECEGYYQYGIDNYELRALKEQLVLRPRNQPLFVFINWMNVHNRYYPSDSYAEGKTIAPYDWSKEHDLALPHIDRRFRSLWDAFAPGGELERTVFVLTSDHGELLGEFNLYGHVKTLFEPVLHVPLLIASSSWREGKKVERPVTLAGLRSALELIADQGRLDSGIVDQLAHAFLSYNDVVAEHRSLEHKKNGRHFRGWMYLAEDGAKLINDEEMPVHYSTLGKDTEFVFDLADDPRETNNLYDSDQKLRQRLLRRYQAWKDTTPPAEPVVGDKILPAGLKQRLRALGYFQ